MELPPRGADGGAKRSGLGRCAHFFWLGVAFDAVGVAVLFTGVFADLLFYDMLLYLGAIIIFISILWWVSWYTGNIEMLPEELVSKTVIVPPAPWAEEAGRGRGRRRHRRRHRSSSSNSSRRRHRSSSSNSSRRRRRRRLSLSLSSVSNTFVRIQRSRRRRSHGTERKATSRAAAGPLEKEESGNPQDACRERVDAKLEDPWGSSRWVWPVFPSSQVSAAQASKNLPLVACQTPVTGSTSRSHTAICSTPQCHPLLPVASQSHPQLSVDSQSQPGIGVLAQNYPLESAASQSHTQLPRASQGQPQDLPPASHAQPPGVKDSGNQTSVTQVPAVPHCVHTLQTAGPQGSPVIQDIHGTPSTQASQCHSSGVQEASKKPAVETPAPHSRELSQEKPHTAPPRPGAGLPATQAQRSDPTGRATAWRKDHP